jgi:NADP-dependent alcohol dehydrogenase
MNNFNYRNPVRIVFGKDAIQKFGALIPEKARILMTYGSGSIKANGVYDQVKKTLQGRSLLEFGGIEPNPRYEILMEAVALARKNKINFLLAVGGGSVLDGTKFIAAAIPFKKGDPWTILSKGAAIESAVELGAVLTLPATGSEMNTNAVVSRESTREKLAFSSPHVYPVFAALDPAVTFSLPTRQVINGIVDSLFTFASSI